MGQAFENACQLARHPFTRRGKKLYTLFSIDRVFLFFSKPQDKGPANEFYRKNNVLYVIHETLKGLYGGQSDAALAEIILELLIETGGMPPELRDDGPKFQDQVKTLLTTVRRVKKAEKKKEQELQRIIPQAEFFQQVASTD